MIVLNSDKELLRVESWDDILRRPGFTIDLDPKQHQLRSIIGRYNFADRIRCGLSNCHTPHARGYIVVTTDGRETNIGKDCGKTYFGVDFETLSRKFDQDILDKENRERLWSFNFRLDEVKQHVRRLREEDHGADWVFKTCRCLMEHGRGVPGPVVQRISQMVKTRTTMLTTTREASEEEAERMEAERGRKLQRPVYVEAPLGIVEGMEALYEENNLRNLLVLDVAERLRQFEDVQIDALTSKALQEWSRWIGGLDSTLDRAVASVESGRRLLQPENLRPFAELLTGSEERQAFAQFLKLLSAN